MAHWLLARRSIGVAQEVAYYHAYAPVNTGLAELARVAGSRWCIEVGFEQAKGEVGLNQYEVRRWPAWYRHITLVLAIYAYLVVLRQRVSQPEIDQIRLSLPELRRLVHLLTSNQEHRQHHLRWMCWRRRHQAVAKRAHQQRRQQQLPANPPLPILPALRLPGLGTLTEAAWLTIASLLPPPARLGLR